MKALIKRSLRLFTRDHAAVFFSLLTVLIVIALYILFLAKEHVSKIQGMVPGAGSGDISWLVSCWILGGMLSIVPVTSCSGVLATMMRDRENKIIKDFKSAPLKKREYPLAMIVSSAVIGFAMSMIAFFLYTAYITATTGHMFSALTCLQITALVALTALLGASLMGFLVSLLKSLSAYNSFCIVVDTLIGFLNGVYVPVGALPPVVQTVTKIVPFSGAASLFRRILTAEPVTAVFGMIPDPARAQAIAEYRAYEGVDLVLGGKVLPSCVIILYMAVIAFAAFGLFMWRFAAKEKEY